MAFCCWSPPLFFSDMICCQMPPTTPSVSLVWDCQLCAGWVWIIQDSILGISNMQSAICKIFFPLSSLLFLFRHFLIRITKKGHWRQLLLGWEILYILRLTQFQYFCLHYLSEKRSRMRDFYHFCTRVIELKEVDLQMM